MKLDEARMYMMSGGRWEFAEEFVNDWLDARSRIMRRRAATKETRARRKNAVL
jgi:hypothetical protein